MVEIRVVTHINPEPWAVGSTYTTRKGGRIKSGISPNLKLKDYQNALREELSLTLGRSMENDPEPMAVRFLFWRQLEEAASLAGKRAKRASHIADATNLQKGAEDVLQHFIGNDAHNQGVMSQIVEQRSDTVPSIILMWGSIYEFGRICTYDYTALVRMRQAAVDEYTTGSKEDRNAW